MAQTRIADLINPEVLAQMVEEELGARIAFTQTIATVDNTLVGRPGNTITIPVWEYIGMAADLAEGVADVPVALSVTSTPFTVKKVAKSAELTDESVLAGYGDPLGSAARQLGKAIADKVDFDVVGALASATLTSGTNLIDISYNGIVDALAKFEEEDFGIAKFLFVAPAQYAQLLKDAKFTPASEFGAGVLQNGVIGRIAGCEVIVSKRLANGQAYIVKPGAVGYFFKRELSIETDRNALAKTTIIAADHHYVAALIDAGKVVNYVVKPVV